jgi:hypothetical protein
LFHHQFRRLNGPFIRGNEKPVEAELPSQIFACRLRLPLAIRRQQDVHVPNVTVILELSRSLGGWFSDVALGFPMPDDHQMFHPLLFL